MSFSLIIQMIFIAIYVFLAKASDRYPKTLTFVRENFHIISAIFIVLMGICCGGYILIG